MIEKTVQELTAAIKDLTNALMLGNQLTVEPKQEQKPEPKQEAKPKAEPKPEPVKEEKPKVEATEDKPALTIEQVRAKLQPVVQKHSPQPVSDALTKLGAASLSELPAGSYGELIRLVSEAICEEI